MVDLTGGFQALLPRVILASSAAETHAVVPANTPEVRDEAGQSALRAMVGPRFDVRFLRGTPGPRTTVVVAHRRGADTAAPADRLLRHCQDRAHGTLTSTLREGLIRIHADLGRPINKRTARTRVAAAAPWLSGHTLLDLPAHRFPALRTAVGDLTSGLP